MAEPHPKQATRRKPKISGKKRWLIFVVVLSVAGIAVGFMVSRLNQPVEGTVMHPAPPAGRPDENVDKMLTTPYYTTKYPARYDLQLPPANSASLDARVLVARQGQRYGTGSRIMLTLTTLPEGGVHEDSAYKLYASQPSVYGLTQRTYGSDTVIDAVRTDTEYQETLLWPHGGYLLTITLITAAKSDLTDNELQTIADNMKW